MYNAILSPRPLRENIPATDLLLPQGYLYADSNLDKAIAHYSSTIELTRSKGENETFAQIIEKLLKKKKFSKQDNR